MNKSPSIKFISGIYTHLDYRGLDHFEFGENAVTWGACGAVLNGEKWVLGGENYSNGHDLNLIFENQVRLVFRLNSEVNCS